jgi:DNA-binding MarR family transcriptional regulator
VVSARRRTRTRGFAEDTDESIGYLLRDVSRRILNAMASELEAHELSLPRYFVLRELFQNDGLTQREIAQRVNVLEPTIVATIDALEAAGWVERERSATDRRKTHVKLTDAGRALRPTLLGYAAGVLDRALVDLDDAEIETLRTTLQRIKSNLG